MRACHTCIQVVDRDQNVHYGISSVLPFLPTYRQAIRLQDVFSNHNLLMRPLVPQHSVRT